MLLVIIGFGAIFVILRKGLIGPIKRLTETMTKIADGDYRAPIRDKHLEDEIGSMNRALLVLRKNSLSRIEAENIAKTKKRISCSNEP